MSKRGVQSGIPYYKTKNQTEEEMFYATATMNLYVMPCFLRFLLCNCFHVSAILEFFFIFIFIFL